MKVLVVGNIGTIFTFEFITEVLTKRADIAVDVLNMGVESSIQRERIDTLTKLGCSIFFPHEYLNKKKHSLCYYIKTVIRQRKCRQYDVVNIHYVGTAAWAIAMFKRKKTRLITSIYGSDLFRSTRINDYQLRYVFNNSNVITVENSFVRDEIERRFGEKTANKTCFLHYGTRNADIMKKMISSVSKEFCKREFGFPIQKIIIMCGYNGNPAHRHIDIIQELSNLPKCYKDKVFLLFHCSYAFDYSYEKKINQALATSGIEGTIFTKFVSGKELAYLRKSVDIMLNMQITDALSASMLECMDAGAVVIKGDWLQYPEIDAKDGYYISLKSFEDLCETIISIIDDRKTYETLTQKNANILDLLSWSNDRDKWLSLF